MPRGQHTEGNPLDLGAYCDPHTTGTSSAPMCFLSAAGNYMAVVNPIVLYFIIFFFFIFMLLLLLLLLMMLLLFKPKDGCLNSTQGAYLEHVDGFADPIIHCDVDDMLPDVVGRVGQLQRPGQPVP